MSEKNLLIELLSSSSRDFVVDNKGNKTPISDLTTKKAIGLYFSAHWCPPCRRFTPMLAGVYEEMKTQNKEVEIIFFSSDRDESSFNEYFSSMPWLAVPYSDRETDKRASQKFSIEGIPALIFVDGNGQTLTANGRDMIVMGGADAYPFTREIHDELKKKELEKKAQEAKKEQEIKNSVSQLSPFALVTNPPGEEAYYINNKGNKTTVANVQQTEVVGLYFSAHWCGPCRNFTPTLAKVYNELKQEGKSFEVVFISSDRDDASFNQYLSEMPWLALPFSDRECKMKLSLKYNVQGIPTLIFVDGRTGELINANGRAVLQSNGAKGFPFH